MTQTPGQKRKDLTPDTEQAWRDFSKAVFNAGELDTRTKQLSAVAVAHVTQCPYCIEGHVPAAKRAGATQGQVMEAIWVAAEMRAGGAVAHSHLAFDAYESARDGK